MASSDKSSPLLRPPAISTTEPKPDTPASTAAGVVALSRHTSGRHLFRPPIALDGWRDGGAGRPPAALLTGPRRHGHSQGGGRIGQVVGQGAGQVGRLEHKAVRGLDRLRPHGPRPRGPKGRHPDAGRYGRRAAEHNGVVGVDDGDAARGLVGPESLPWPGRSAPGWGASPGGRERN